MNNQGNYFPQQGPIPNGPGPGNVNGPGTPYPQQTPYNPYYPTQTGVYQPQQPMPGVYGPTPYGVPVQTATPVQINVRPATVVPTPVVPVPARQNVQVNIQPVAPTVVHQEKVFILQTHLCYEFGMMRNNQYIILNVFLLLYYPGCSS